jgi:alpha-1,3-glucosyltransferase
MMYGLMILSIAFIKEGQYLKSALVYAILLNFKHIYLYCAPCFGIIYLKKAVFDYPSFKNGFRNLIILALQTILVFAISFGPFIWIGGMDQVK